jgi:hypothetical protein
VSFIVCVVLCAVFRLIVVLFCVMCYLFVVSYCKLLPPGKNLFAVNKYYITLHLQVTLFSFLCKGSIILHASFVPLSTSLYIIFTLLSMMIQCNRMLKYKINSLAYFTSLSVARQYGVEW